MIVEFSGAEAEFKAFLGYLKGIGVDYRYHHRRSSEPSTKFSVEVSQLDLISLGLLRDYAERERGVEVTVVLDGKRYDAVRDHESLRKRLKEMEETGKLVRGYHP
ncbi:MAG: hypothetical protein QW172_03590 [Candidatus Bathyarchaeia archaeon]